LRIEKWTEIFKELTDAVVKSLEADKTFNVRRSTLDVQRQYLAKKSPNMNSILLMLKSGARGKSHQIKNLIGAIGPIITTSGALFQMPIASNYITGLSPLEHFMMTVGARYGLIATATVSGLAGTIMRRMVSACQDIIITEEDCGTTDHITMESLSDGLKRISGRVTAGEIKHTQTSQVIAKAGQIIDETTVQEIKEAGIRKVKIRSPLTCEAEHGTCAKCYGIDLATGNLVKLGEPVGVIAGTAMGEPATQLTFRLFHLSFGTEDYALTGLPRLEALLEAKETAKITVDGTAMSLKDALSQKGGEVFQSLMLDELMRLYNEYGIGVNSKHFEILIGCMLSQVQITDPGSTDFYENEVVSRSKFRSENRKIKGTRASAKPILNGLYKSALNTESFIAAAAFGDTVNVLAQAAVRCSRDELRGMRENLIVGKLIPAGTGYPC
jgi:DNA-directed RNA polymerase subunit beta'